VLTLSRGASVAVLVGLAVCVLVRGGRATLTAAGCALAAIVVLGAALGAFPDVLTLGTDRDAQASQGAVFTPIALLVTVAAGLAFARLRRTRASALDLPLGRGARGGLAAATTIAVLAAAMAVAGNGTESTDVPRTAARITRVETNRGHYWSVAWDAFRRHPLNGIGTGSFLVEWTRKRGPDQNAYDAHSLYVETLAELGIVGGLLLLAFLGTLGAATLRAARDGPRDASVAAAAGVLAAFVLHAGLDWDWEMPSVVMVPLILSAAALSGRKQRQ
jgi:O-antigen ligase